MEKNRQGEKAPIPKRHQRLYKKGEHWYVATRESPIGPFSDFRSALRVGKEYKHHLQTAPVVVEAVRWRG